MITLIGGSFGNLKVIHANFSTITYSTLTDINLGFFFFFLSSITAMDRLEYFSMSDL